MTDRGEVMELVCDAFGRQPPLLARYRRWFQLDRLRRAAEETRGSGATGGVYGLIRPARDPNNPVTESTLRLLVSTPKGAFRLERDWRDEPDRTPVHVSDGVTTWRPNYAGAFHAGPSDPDALPAVNLLDPSWLAGYDWGEPVPDTCNGRDILVVHARLAAARPPVPGGRASTVLRQRPPSEVDVLIDAQYGFLHRMTGLIESQPFVVEEFLDVVIDPPIDETVFRIDASRFEVIDTSERERPSVFERFTDGNRSQAGERSIGRPGTPRRPGPALPAGAVGRSVQEDLDARFERLPVQRLRRWSDYSEFRAVESDHVGRLTRRYSLSDDHYYGIQAYWFARIDDELAELVDRLRHGEFSRHDRHRRLRKYHLDQLWWNTFGPGGETWLGDHFPIRRFLFRLHWRP